MKNFWIPYNGKSMSPLLKDRDQILIESVTLSELKQGDIILFLDKESHELTLHRIIELPFQTKGDFSLLLDSDSREGFLGRALGYERKYFYRKFPEHHSLFQKYFVLFSKGRMKGFFTRKLSLIQLMLLTSVFELLCEKTRSDRNREQLINDL